MSDDREFQQHKREFVEALRELGIQLPEEEVDQACRNIQARAQEHGVSMDDVVRENLEKLLDDEDALSDIAEIGHAERETFDVDVLRQALANVLRKWREDERYGAEEVNDVGEDENSREEPLDAADLDVAPWVIAALDQAGPEILRKPPVPVPYVLVFKLVNRYLRLNRMRSLAMPSSFVEKELALIERAVEELANYAIDGGLVEPLGRSSA